MWDREEGEVCGAGAETTIAERSHATKDDGSGHLATHSSIRRLSGSGTGCIKSLKSVNALSIVYLRLLFTLETTLARCFGPRTFVVRSFSSP